MAYFFTDFNGIHSSMEICENLLYQILLISIQRYGKQESMIIYALK